VRSQTKKDKLVFQEWGFCGWAGNPPKENKVLISKNAQPWISADHIVRHLGIKVEFTLEQDMKGQRGNGGIVLLYL
jgi:hypothetical protein